MNIKDFVETLRGTYAPGKLDYETNPLAQSVTMLFSMRAAVPTPVPLTMLEAYAPVDVVIETRKYAGMREFQYDEFQTLTKEKLRQEIIDLVRSVYARYSEDRVRFFDGAY